MIYYTCVCACNLFVLFAGGPWINSRQCIALVVLLGPKLLYGSTCAYSGIH